MSVQDLTQIEAPARANSPDVATAAPAPSQVHPEAAHLLQLQRRAGNRAVANLIAVQRAPTKPPPPPAGDPAQATPTADASASGSGSVAEAEARLVGASAARKAAEARLATPMKPGPGETEMDVWVARAAPALEAAKARLAEAQAAHELAKARLNAAPATGPTRSRLGREAAEANAIVGDAEGALGQAMTQAVRARRVGEGLAASRAASAARGGAPGGGAPGGGPPGGGAPGGGAPGGGAPSGGAPAGGAPGGQGGQGGQPARPELPTPEDLDARLDAIEAHGTAEGQTLVRAPAKGLVDAKFSEAGSELHVGNVSGATVHEGQVPLDGAAAPPARKAPAPPETWLMDPKRANLTDPDEIVDEQFRPNRSGREYDVRNVQVAAGPGGDRISTPSGPEFGENRVVGGARGATLDPSAGAWQPGAAPYQRPHNPLGQQGAFAEKSASDWSAWEQGHGALSESQRYALWFYSDDLSGHLNPALRGQRPGQFVTDPTALHAVASDLDQTMRPVPFDTIVHRKASMADFADLGITDPAELPGAAGKSYAHAGYTSTAVEPGHWSGDIDIVIQVPKGTRGRYMGGDSAAAQPTNPVKPAAGAPTASMPGEMEFLVERGTSFRIEKAEFDQASGRWRVEVRVAEQGVKAGPLTNPVPLPGSSAKPGAAAAGPGPAGGPTGGSKASPTTPADTPATPAEPAQDVRARRVAEGLRYMGARSAARTEAMKVEPIDDPEVAARMFVEGKGAAGGNVPMSRRVYERQWRDAHHQLTDPPAAGWQKADGTVVVDSSNPKVREAIERLAKERTAAPKASAPQPPHVAAGPVPVPTGKSAGAAQTDEASATQQPAAPDQAPAATGPSTQSPAPKRPKVATDVDFSLNQAKLTVKVGGGPGPASTVPDAHKPKAAPSVAVSVSPTEVAANVEHMRPTGGGGQHGATAGASYNPDTGNTQASVGYRVATKGGTGASVSLTGGNSVTVDDPEEVEEGVWIVSYVISDSSGLAAGGTAKAGPVELGAGGSDTKAKLQTGSRKFNTESEALKFKKNIRHELEGESTRQAFFPPTTANGALMIPPGESRGVGASDTLAGNVSAGYATGSIGKSGYKSSTQLLSVYHAAGYKVQVTTTVSTEKGSAWTAGGLGLTNESGGSESALYAVTFEFDLSNPGDQRLFETFCKRPLPIADGRQPLSRRRLTTQGDHDNYALAGAASSFAGSVSQEEVVDAQGVHDKYTGTQTEDHTPGRILGVFEDEKHASAEIVSSLENGKESGFAAKMKVSGESGEFNRRQFGKIFEGASYSGTAHESGKWTLTAAIPKEALRELEQTNVFKGAKTEDEKLRIYSAYVEKNGAQMLGAQVGITSTAWNLELKGDDNFPGERGRAKLNELRQRLSIQLQEKPDDAYHVAGEAKETLRKLDARFKAVSEKKNYTDLPDGLREEQLQVIRMHRNEFDQLRQRALSIAGQHDPNEKIEDVEKRATSPHGYDRFDPQEVERIKLQDSMTLSTAAITKTRLAIRSASKAIAQVRTGPGAIRFRDGVGYQKMLSVTGSVDGAMKEAVLLDKQQVELEQQVRLLNEKMDHELYPEPRLRAMHPLEHALGEHSAVLNQQLDKLVEIGRELYPVALFAAMEKKPGNKFWLSVSSPREDEPEEEREPTSLAI